MTGAVGAPETRLLAVTTMYGNVELETTEANARGLLALTGRTTPVVAGARPLVFPQIRRTGERSPRSTPRLL